ncbi:MAG: type I 3-dehydroquinate dehydratase [Candidatus Omnitrophica bacterium]|nr:type I 3-dehydroquinate dehydratase [Candidatus Omnitrophota bacterium]
MKDKLTLVLVGGEDRKELLAALKRCGWCEFRIDEFLKKNPEDKLKKWLTLKTSTKKIGTVRWHKEHQNQGLAISEKRRLEIYRDILEYVDYVDVEIKSKIAKEVIKSARKKGKKVIVSYHNFSRTPSLKFLKKVYNKGRRLKPDIIKIATDVNSPDELLTLLFFTHTYSKSFPVVITPMGVSFIERLIPLYFGSLFTYISFNTKTAPGQVSYKEIQNLKYIEIDKKWGGGQGKPHHPTLSPQ